MHRLFLPIILIFSVISGFCPSPSSGNPLPVEQEKLPLWEVGLLGLGSYFPHYRGSDEYQLYAFPLPYFVYRGKVVKANRDGLRGIFWRNKHFETDISLSGNPPVPSDNEAREGMEELDGLIEIGPALRYYFYEFGERDSFFLQGNVRVAFSLGFDDGIETDHRGYITDFSLVYRDSHMFREQNIRFHLSTGIQFADENFHNFFYEVSPDDATVYRTAYDVEGGYGGLQVSGSIVKELTPNFWLSGYWRWMNSGGAEFADSPLVGTENNYIIGAMLVWKIWESEESER